MPMMLPQTTYKNWLSPDVKSPEIETVMLAYALEDAEFHLLRTRLTV